MFKDIKIKFTILDIGSTQSDLDKMLSMLIQKVITSKQN